MRPDHDTRIHAELIEPIAMDAPFVVGGALLQHPGIQAGPRLKLLTAGVR